jgi:tetraacyldisaccharide 4'-kinase
LNIESFINRIWYGASPCAVLLLPLSWLYQAVLALHALPWRLGLSTPAILPVPVIVVGNLSVGGTGKTPLVLWLAERLREAGRRPGILCRGYGGAAVHWPQRVRQDSDPTQCGDEAVLLAHRSAVPVMAGPDRVAAARALLDETDCDVLLSDDGLQHRALPRCFEIVVVDGARRFGNGRLLPAGPLREPLARLSRVDAVVVNGGVGAPGEFPMRLAGDTAHALDEPARRQPLAAFAGRRVHALAGIGHPERFFAHLRAHGLDPIPHPFPDHHRFVLREVSFDDGLPVLMTEKDAVKCSAFALPQGWVIPVVAVLDDGLATRILQRLEGIPRG